MRKTIFMGFLLLFLTGLIQCTADDLHIYSYQYAVKFICGKSDGKALAPGEYYTAINVHNPTDTNIVFRKKIALAPPNGEPGEISQFSKHMLDIDQALEITCPEISRQAHSQWDFLTGFVVIESNVELDVVAVYTGTGSSGEVTVIDIEIVKPRSMPGIWPDLPGTCPDLIVTNIEKPQWDSINNRSVIRATVKNIGNEAATPTIARVIDPTTSQSTGAPYNAIADVPELQPDESITVTFYLPYWVYNPDVTLEVTADYKNMLTECNEDNNVKVFNDLG